MLNYISAQMLTFMHAHSDELHNHVEEHTEVAKTVADVHSHSTDGNVWESAWELITEPAHAITEVFYSLLFDALLIPVTILVYRKIREPKLRAQIHAEIDSEHGVDHDDCNGKKLT